MYKCSDCGGSFQRDEIKITEIFGLEFPVECYYCIKDRYFRKRAVEHIRLTYKLRYGEYSEEHLEIEIVRAKIRYCLLGKDTKFIRYKPENMITTVNNSTELRQALNENLHALLTKKRKLVVVKEVNNTLGKLLSDVKMELMAKALSGDEEPVSWFNDQQKQIGEQYGVVPRLKQAQ